MRTYESTMAEVEALEAEQRAIIDKGTPGDSDSQALLQAQGEIQALRRVAEDLHKAEVAELKAAAERATIITPDKDSQNKQAMRDFRNMLKSMRPGEEVTLVSDALAAGSGSGSYLVPQEWHDKVEEYRFESNFMRQDGAMVVKTESTHNIPVLSALGTAAITGENLAYTNSEPTVSQVILSAYKLTNSALVSEELLEDSAYDVEGLLARAFGLGFGQGELGYAMTGNGSAQPTGIFNKTADLTTDTQAVMTNDEVIETVYSLAPEYRDSGCIWMMDNTMALYLAQKKVDVTTSGTTPFAWPTLLDGKNPTLLGYKVRLASAIADKAAGAKVLAFGNPAHYVIGERGPMKLQKLQLALYQTTFGVAQRFDSKPLNADAFVVVALHA